MNFNYEVMRNPRWWLLLPPLILAFIVLGVCYVLGVVIRCIGDILCLGFKVKTPEWFDSLAVWVKRGEK